MNRLPRRLIRLLLIASLTLLTALIASATPPSAVTEPVFFDVSSDDWYAQSVSYVIGNGLFTGRSVGHFEPDGTMDRAMFYSLLCRMAGQTVSNDVDTNLTDVRAGQWYTGAVVWAISSGIADCREDGTFGINDPLPRWELCLALARFDAMSSAGILPTGISADFSDLDTLDEETCAAIAACRAAGVADGRSGGRFDPYSTASRAQTAKVIALYHQRYTQTKATNVASVAWDDVTGWTGELYLDFPLSHVQTVTYEKVNWLNARILRENVPAKTAASGCTIDGDRRHLTNHGSGGEADCINVTTTLSNAKSGTSAGILLAGRQEYYGYHLEVSGVTQQDKWHRLAQSTGKSPWQCTWWAWGRAAQYLELAYGKDFTTLCGGRSSLGNGGNYYSSLKPYFLSDQTPTANSIVSWSCGTYGHVAYVEAVDDNGIWVSMADSGHAWRGVTYIVKSASSSNPYPLNWFSYERLNGFNHLDFYADGSAIS